MNRAAALAGILLAGACRSDGGVTVIPQADLPASVYASPSPAPNQPGQIPGKGRIYLVEGERLIGVTRALPEQASGLPEALLRTLLAAPEPRTRIPPDTRLLGIGVVGGVATLNLSQEFELGAAGNVLALRVAQIVYTVTEDTTVRSVLLVIEGNAAPIPAGDARTVLERAVTRADYAQLAPA